MKKILILAVMIIITMMSSCANNSEINNSEIEETIDSSIYHSTETSINSEVEETDPMMEIYRLDITSKWDAEMTENKETDEWCYSVYTKGDIGWVHIYQYKGAERDIIVPDSLDGYPVVQVLDPRMYTAMTYDSNLQSFTRAYDINEITSIQFPNTVYRTYDMFDDTVWYENQPNGEVYIGKIFYKYKGDMPSGTVIDVKEGTLGICEASFNKCKNLEKITMPDSVIFLDDLVFHNCTALMEVQLSRNIIGLRMKIFAGATSLTEIYIPKSLCWVYKSFTDSSIEKVYYEGRSFSTIDGYATLTAYYKEFELETNVSFAY